MAIHGQATAITQLLGRFRDGDPAARDELLPIVYDELRRRARHQRRSSDQTLNTTAVVHEAFLKLCRGAQPEWRDRAHFFAVAARAMRQVLVDHARARAAGKRGGPGFDLPLDEVAQGSSDRRQAASILDLHQALDDLAEHAPRLAQVVELRFFAGMTSEEIGAVLELSTRSVRRDWLKARALLHRRLETD